MAGLWSVSLRVALDAFGALGLDVDAICLEAGIDRSQLADPNRRFPLSVTAKIWPAAQAKWARPGLGLHAGANVPFGALAALDYAMATAPTFGDGIDRLAHFFDINTGGMTSLRIERSPEDEVRLVLDGYGASPLRDYALSVFAVRFRTFGVRPVGAVVAGPLHAPVPDYEAALFCRTSSGGETSFQFDAETWAMPLPERFPGLRQIVEHEVERLRRDTLDVEDLPQEVRALLVRSVGGPFPGVGEAAKALGLSKRSLQRRLSHAGTSYDTLRDETRLDVAMTLLSDATLNIAEVGFLLGYSEPSAFTRAFKRWTGQSPARARGLRQEHR